MDFLTHALVGALLGELSPERIKNRQVKGALAAISPDIANLVAYPYLGIKSGNIIPYAYPRDFYANPWIVDHWTWVPWEITHSFLFWGFIVMPLLLYFKKPLLFGVAYASHLLLDMPSHSGIWSTVPFIPLIIGLMDGAMLGHGVRKRSSFPQRPCFCYGAVPLH